MMDAPLSSASNFEIDPSDKTSAPQLIREVAKTVVRDWDDVPLSEIVVKEVSGGITNMLYRAVVDNRNKNTTSVLVRVYGNKTDLIIDRKRELVNIKRLYTTGFGPKLYGTFKNGYVYEFYPGAPVAPDELASCKWNVQIASQLAKYHQQEMVEELALWKTLDNWLSLVPDTYTKSSQTAKLQELGGKDKIRSELQILKDTAAQLASPLVFSHNDLLGGNIIVNDANGEVKFIDFEYASTNYQAFDIANHFNEFAGFEADYSRYPSKEQQYQFLRSYLTTYKNGTAPTDQELHKLYVQVNKFALISHMFWAIWALVQGHISKLDFDFVDYAGLRFAEYYNKKDEFLGLE